MHLNFLIGTANEIYSLDEDYKQRHQADMKTLQSIKSLQVRIAYFDIKSILLTISRVCYLSYLN